MGAAMVLLLVGLGALAAGVLIGRYYVPDDRQLRRTARHSRSYMRALSHLVAREHEPAIAELRAVVEESVEDVEPYFALGALFRSRGEHERAIRVHQALALREHDRRKLKQRAMYELGLDFRAAGMPRRATRALEEVVLEEPDHDGARRVLAALYEEQARFAEAAGLWQRLARRGEHGGREHHLLVAAAQAAIARGDVDQAKAQLKAAHKLEPSGQSAHWLAAAAELAAARGHHDDALDRLKQALIAEPALAPHLLPALIAAEQARTGEAPRGGRRDDLEDDATETLPVAARALPAGDASPASSSTTLPIRGARETSPERRDEPATTTGAGGAASPAIAGEASTPEAGRLAGPEAGRLAGPEAGRLAGPEAGRLAGPEAGRLAGPEAGRLAGPEAGGSAAPGLVDAQGHALVPAPPTGAELAVASRQLMATLAAAPLDDAIALVPEARAGATVIERVLAALAEVEAATGPRLELALIRAQLVPATDAAGQAALARELAARFPEALAARVAVARLALASGDAPAIRAALDRLVAEDGALAWALRGRWQCAHCGHRPGPFSWRCSQCRRWATLRMETGIEPPPRQPRERRAAPRIAEGLLLARDEALPAATLEGGVSDLELVPAPRRSLLGRVGGWFSGALRRDAP
jgi:lipopolysaccharide biosynthesis regulator YciM